MPSGPEQDIMLTHTRRGFVALDEKVLEQVLINKGKAVPDQEDENVDRKTELQMACLAAVNPGIDDVTATGYMHTGFFMKTRIATTT